MKVSRFLVVAAILALACTVMGGVTQAQTLVDPKIVLGGTGSCAEKSITSETQSFEAIPTDCQVDFTNNINSDGGGQTLFSLVVTVAGGPFLLTCDTTEESPLQGPSFQAGPNSCVFTEAPNDAIDAFLTFSLTFDPAFGSTVDVTLSQTPEPATLVLVGTGLTAVVANKKRAKAAR
jgi:hypothetical protein